MRLLHLVEQHDLIGPPPHRLGQHAAFVIADIARRRADQPAHGMLLHELRHVDAHHRVVVVEQEARERLGQLGLAHARGAEEEERAQRPVRVLQARPRAAHGLGNRDNRIALPDHPLADSLFHLEQLLALALQHPLDRHACPAADDTGDVVRSHFLAQQRVLGHALRLGELLLELGNPAIGKLARLAEIALPLRLLELDPRRIERFLDLAFRRDLVALVLPAGGKLARLLLQIGQFLAQRSQPVLRSRIAFLGECHFLDLELDDPPVEVLDLLGLALHFHAQTARRLVHQVDRLVGQEAVRDVAVGERRRRDNRAVGDPHAVVQLVLLLQPAQDRDSVLHRRLAHEHRLEPPLQRRVLLDVLLVLVERRRADAVQLAACQGRLQ